MPDPVTIELERLPHAVGLPMPAYATEHASGMDICAAIESELTIAPGDVALVPTGFRIAVPPGYEAQVRPRSGLAAKFGIGIPNSPGTIDADYRGEVKVIVINHGAQPFVVSRGDRIAQIVIAPVAQAMIVERETLSETTRGDGGFGHTGHKASVAAVACPVDPFAR